MQNSFEEKSLKTEMIDKGKNVLDIYSQDVQQYCKHIN